MHWLPPHMPMVAKVGYIAGLLGYALAGSWPREQALGMSCRHPSGNLTTKQLLKLIGLYGLRMSSIMNNNKKSNSKSESLFK